MSIKICPVMATRCPKTQKRRQLILTNLTRNVTKTHLEEIFGTFGKLRNVKLPANKYNLFIHDGYAIIEYEKRKYCRLALRFMDGGQIDGQVIQVEPYYEDEHDSDEMKCKQNNHNTAEHSVLLENLDIVNLNPSHLDERRTSDTDNSQREKDAKNERLSARDKRAMVIDYDDISSCDSYDSLGSAKSSKNNLENNCQMRLNRLGNKSTDIPACSKIETENNPMPKSTREGDRGKHHDEEDREPRSTSEIDKERLYQIAKDNLRRLMYFGEIPNGTELYRLAELHIKRWDKEDRMTRRSQRTGRRYSDSEDELLGDIAQKKTLKKSQPIEINVRGGHRSASPEDLRFLYPVSKGYRPIINPDIPWVEVDPHFTGKKKKSKLDLDEKTDDSKDEVSLSENEKMSGDHEMVRPGLGLDVGVLHSQRLTSLKKLEEDPGNVVALQQLQSVTKLIEVYENTRTPMTKLGGNDDELRNLIFPDGEGLGHHLLKKMGWTPGTGLGRHQQGIIEPLAPKTQLDTKGLVTEDEKVRDITRQLLPGSPNEVTSWSRTPVSILNEHCWKSKRLIPKYEMVHEDGPAHKKNFQYAVIINGISYQPTTSCGNKKEAKQLAAAVAAEAFGLLTN